jgi:hypothetical protein
MHLRSGILACFLLIVLLVSAACQVGGSETGSGSASIIVRNKTTQAICTIYVSPSTEPNWTDQRLTLQQLAPEAEFTINVEPGSWDVRAEPCDLGDEIYEETYGIELGANDNYTWSVPANAFES